MKERGWIALCVLALAVLAVMNLPEKASVKVKGAIRDGVSPLQAGVRGGMREIGETWRYVRGIGDLALENQKGVFEVLHPSKYIGLSLMDTMIMSPEKSVTAIIGIREGKNTAKMA